VFPANTHAFPPPPLSLHGKQHAGGTRTPSQGAAAELTEAQKIFGVGETFAPHAVAVSAQPRGREQEWAPAESDEPQRLTAELIAESARWVGSRAEGGGGGEGGRGRGGEGKWVADGDG
jgi:hypothetical protein